MALLNLSHTLRNFLSILLVIHDVHFVRLQINDLLLMRFKLFSHEVHSFLVSCELTFICQDSRLEIFDQIVMSV